MDNMKMYPKKYDKLMWIRFICFSCRLVRRRYRI